LAGAFLALAFPGFGAPVRPVTPDASPEVRALLQALADISGSHTLTGQHNYPNIRSRNSDFAARHIGRTPVVFSTDWGHAKDGNTDSYLARPDIVDEAIRQHRKGSLVTICWHAIPPTADEPGTLRPLPGADPLKLASVHGRLTDSQFLDLLSPGTPLHEHWCAQVDAIAVFLKKLEAARVPVLWRPCHEMNGDWFWWGGRSGEHGTVALYRQMFDRLTRHHHLTNLIWVWSVDRPVKPGMEFHNYFPGADRVDILALDVYRNDFAQSYYDELVKLAKGKPIALAEVGNSPTPEILARQPRWAYYVTWAGMVRNTSRRQYDALLHDPRILNLEDPAYAEAMAAYRMACSLPPLRFNPPPLDFSGFWVLDEDRSSVGHKAAVFAPARMEVAQHGNEFTVKSTQIPEYTDNQVTEQKLSLGGPELKSELMGSPCVTKVRMSDAGDQLLVETVMEPSWMPPGAKLLVKDRWFLSEGGAVLTIQRTAALPQGDQMLTLVFNRG